jgi:hypothetical protein
MISNYWMNARVELGARISQYPSIYLPLVRWFTQYRNYVVGRGIQLVIEGFPRSANTFAVAAFLFAQDTPTKIAHHLHAPAQVIQAVRWGIPTIVLVRPPKDAVISLQIRQPFRTLRRTLILYSKYYSSLVKYRQGFIVAPFDEVISNFGNIIESVNARFNTSFKTFEHTPENLEVVYAMIEQMDMADQNISMVTEETVSRPSKEREALKRDYSNEFDDPSVIDGLCRAEKIFNFLVNNSG